jgi:hypothetical protein
MADACGWFYGKENKILSAENNSWECSERHGGPISAVPVILIGLTQKNLCSRLQYRGKQYNMKMPTDETKDFANEAKDITRVKTVVHNV